MLIAVYLPLIASVLLSLSTPWTTRRLPPAIGARLVLVAGIACAMAAAYSVAALAATFVGALPIVAAIGGWSSPVLHQNSPVSPFVAKIAVVAALVMLLMFVWTIIWYSIRVLRVRRATQHLRASPSGLVVVDNTVPDAYAVPRGRAGRVVVSTGMLRALDPDERRVVFAHEAAHLHHHHHLYRAGAACAAGLNPLLFALPGAVRHLTERWADEEAAEHVGDRRLAAHALAHAALARGKPQTACTGAGAIHGGDVPRRVTALLAPRPKLGPAASVLAAVLAISVVATVEVSRDTDALFDIAQSAPHAHRVAVLQIADQTTHHFIHQNLSDTRSEDDD